MSITKDGMVVHVLGPHPYDEYVGRSMPPYGLGQSEWANPYPVKKHGRAESLKLYEMAQRALLRNIHPEHADALSELRGRTLACWCGPRDGYLEVDDPLVCHAQVLLRLAKEFEESKDA